MIGEEYTMDNVRILHPEVIQIRNLREEEHDPYHRKKKLSEPTLCPSCGAVYRNGRWQWGGVSQKPHTTLCPACMRIEEENPAGLLTLEGDFLFQHFEEILHVLHNVEDREKTDHALKRIMSIEEDEDGNIVVSCTDPHLARSLGEAIHHAYKGDLKLDYQKGEFFLRVHWQR
jgi:NMD protein affecting ribosome stability and mRNA decay